MKSGYIRFILALVCLIPTMGNAVFYRGSVWKKTFGHGDNFVYCLSDLHLDYKDGKITKKQQEDLSKLTKEKRALCILEDELCYKDPITDEQDYGNLSGNNFGSDDKSPYKISIDKAGMRDAYNCTPMLGLAQLCKTHDIEHESVEFRHLALEVIKKSETVRLGYHATFGLIINKLNQCIQDDGYPESLKKLYAQVIQQFEKNPLSQDLMQCTVSFNDFIEQRVKAAGDSSACPRFGEVYYKTSKSILQLGDKLIDCKILSALQGKYMYPHIFICAGGMHIKEVEKYLPTLGYTKVQQYGDQELNEQEIIPSRNIHIKALDLRALFAPQVSSSYKNPYKKFILAAFLGIGSFVAYKVWQYYR